MNSLKKEIAKTKLIVEGFTGEYANTESAKDMRSYLRGLETALKILEEA